jgi:hypothetical protein
MIYRVFIFATASNPAKQVFVTSKMPVVQLSTVNYIKKTPWLPCDWET